MHFVAIDGLEAALLEVPLGGGGEKVELAQAARGQTVKELTNELPSDAVAAVFGKHGHGADQGRELIGLSAAAADHLLPVASDEKRLPVIVDAGGGKVVRH